MLLDLLLACTPDPAPRVDPPGDTAPPTTDTTDGPTTPLPLRNVLMISIDTTRRDHIDRYATDGVVRTPFLSRLLAEGVALDDHQQCSNWTFGSTTCTLEGRLNEDTGWMARLAGASPVPAGRRTLAARLAERGYHTILVSSNAWITEEWNNAQGYTESSRETTADTLSLLTAGESMLESAVALGADPWMLHVHLVQAHPPYTPPDPYDDAEEALPPIPWDLDSQSGQYEAAASWPAMSPAEQELLVQHLEARYTGELQLQDDELAAWFAQFDAQGWLDGTLVVVWTDHGEQFFEHGNQAHAWSLGGEETDAVAGFWGKGLDAVAWDEPTHAVDVVPTVLELLGMPSVDADLAGYPLGTAPADRPRFSSTVARLGPEMSVVRDGWKLMYDLDGTVHVWDRNTDPTEQIDLYDPADPVTLDLWNALLPQVPKVQALTPEWPFLWPPGLPQQPTP